MTREQIMAELIQSWSPPEAPPQYSPFIDDAWDNIWLQFEIRWDAKLADWVAHASPEWLGHTLDLLTEPPDLEQYRDTLESQWVMEVVETDWEDRLQVTLAAWARKDASLFFSSVETLLLEARTRFPILLVISWINGRPYRGRDLSLKYLLPLVGQLKQLTLGEAQLITGAIYHLEGDEAHQALLSLRESSAIVMPQLKDLVEYGIKYQEETSTDPRI